MYQEREASFSYGRPEPEEWHGTYVMPGPVISRSSLRNIASP